MTRMIRIRKIRPRGMASSALTLGIGERLLPDLEPLCIAPPKWNSRQSAKADRPSGSPDRARRADGRGQVDRRPPPGQAAGPAVRRQRRRDRGSVGPRAPPSCSSDLASMISAMASGGWSPGWSTATSGSLRPAAAPSSTRARASCSMSGRSPSGSTLRSTCWPSAPSAATIDRCSKGGNRSEKLARLSENARANVCRSAYPHPQRRRRA